LPARNYEVRDGRVYIAVGQQTLDDNGAGGGSGMKRIMGPPKIHPNGVEFFTDDGNSHMLSKSDAVPILNVVTDIELAKLQRWQKGEEDSSDDVE
jgi:tRNA G37 N-methylase TrmD